MKKWVFTMSERDLYTKVIAGAEKADVVYIIYTKRTGQVSISDFSLFTEAKCKINFVEAPSEVSEDTAIAFAYGKIYGENPDVILGSKNVTLTKVASTQPAAKQQRKRTTKPKKEEKTFINPPEEVIVLNSEPEEKPKRGRKKKEAPTVEPSSDFDKAYFELENCLDNLKTKSFNPATNIGGISAAVKIIDDEGVSFEEAINNVVSPATAKKIIKAFDDGRTFKRVIELARAVNALDKG